jgi:DNA repair photolyase
MTSFDDTYFRLFDATPPASVTRGESDADVLSVSRGFLSTFDYTMQLQVGCPAGCLFCYVPSGTMLTPPSVRGANGDQWGFQVREKHDAVAKFEKHVLRGSLADKVIYWSGVTDPYVSPPAATRQVWEVLNTASEHLRPRRLVVQSRFRPDRDAAAMGQFARETHSLDGGPALVVSYSIGTDRDDMIRAWERATPPFAQRMKAIETLCNAGVYLVATLSPLGYWDDLMGTLERFREWGVAYITTLFFKENTSSSNTPRRFLRYLKAEHPTLLDPIWQAERVAEMQAVFGEDRVLIGQAGFTSLAAPQGVYQRAL